MADVKADYDSLRARHATKHDRPMVSLEQARANAHADRLGGLRAAGARAAPGVHVLEDYDLAELRAYIDWQPFFNAWEMKGKFPDILNNPATGEAARKLYDDAQEMLDRIIEREVAHRQRASSGCSRPTPWATTSRSTPTTTAPRSRTTLHHLRQQGQHRDGVPNRSLADFVAPRDTGLADHVGALRRDGRARLEDRIKEFKAELDDYSAILLESLADRLAEAFAERLHQRVRTEFWGHAADEQLSNEDLIAEQYAGIRPAPGYPACPDHTEKARSGSCSTSRQNTGIELTESMAMWPGAAVSGWYFSHPKSQYFVVGRLGRDQVADYAERKGWTLTETERWLSPEPRLRPGGLMRDASYAPGELAGVPAAVLWDMDGTLVDTEPYWIEAEFALAEKYGGTWSRGARAQPGRQRPARVRPLHPRAHGDRPPARGDRRGAARRRRRAVSRSPCRGGRARWSCSRTCAAHGVPCALVTMSYRRFVAPILATLPADTFAAIVTGDAVTHGKPHPEPYLKGAAALGLDPADCLAIEDSNTGARSAESAGCVVLCVPNHVPMLDGDRRVFADTLTGMTTDGLRAAYSSIDN